MCYCVIFKKLICFSFVEPIYGKNHFLETVLSLSGNNRNSVKDQFTMNPLMGEYQYDSIFSNELSNNMYTEQLELNYRWVSEKIDLTAGARVLAIQTHSTTYYGGLLARDTLYNRWNWSPNLRFRYKFGRKEFARIVDEYALKENGELVYSEDMTSIKIIPGKEDECSNKIVELKELEVDLSQFEFTLDEFDSLELTLAEMSSILPLIKD